MQTASLGVPPLAQSANHDMSYRRVPCIQQIMQPRRPYQIPKPSLIFCWVVNFTHLMPMIYASKFARKANLKQKKKTT